jgi:hypothetical protein
LIEVSPELICSRRSVKGRVVSHSPEQRLTSVLILAILSQALLSEFALGVLPFIDLALPAFVGPSRRAESNE